MRRLLCCEIRLKRVLINSIHLHALEGAWALACRALFFARTYKANLFRRACIAPLQQYGWTLWLARSRYRQWF